MTDPKEKKDPKRAARQVNPIITKAAGQVRKSKTRRRKLADIPRRDCPGQLTLFTREELRTR
ncbi:hypothetical protein [Nocardia terpenica]|uniref:Uncharacterized protein n=1 Tax=Nocardia terpenica TaxID=455432 RepID=A0A6G9Z0S9_9NOCA|nr:hypothetical protein [Nocardia terpenica]QIS19219.1 hypothetical protein F6W96_13880 [Nocardia terpenica]